MFWILLLCCNLPLPAANSKFQVFPTKVACHPALQNVSPTNCTLSLQMVLVTRRGRVMAVTNPTLMSHGGNTPGPGTSASAASKPGPASQLGPLGPAQAGGSCGNCECRMFSESSVALLRLPRTAVATAVL